MAAALAGPLSLLSESLRRAGEFAMAPEEQRQKDDLKKKEDAVLAEQKRQQDELAGIKAAKETKDAQDAMIADKKKLASENSGRSSTLLGVLNPATSVAPTKIKTLLGE